MKKRFNHFYFNAILAVTVLSLTTNLFADDPDKLPTAEMVMKNYVKASGGMEKIKAIKSLHMSGKFEIAGMGVEGKLESITVSPNKIYMNVDLGANGTQTVVCDGNTAWDISTMMGPRLLEGKEKARALDQANMVRMYDPISFYKEIKVLGMEEVDGEKTYKVTTETKDGFKTTEFYSLKTGLPIAAEATVPNAMGDIPMTTKFVEYKEVAGVKLPSKIEIKMAAGAFVQSFDKIEINKEVDKKKFEIPEEIQTIIDNTNG